MMGIGYTGTHDSELRGNQIAIPLKLVKQIVSREGNLPDVFYGIALKECCSDGKHPYVALFPYSEIGEKIEQFGNKCKWDGLSEKIFEIEADHEHNSLLIPQDLLELVRLGQHVLFAGMVDYIELWDRNALARVDHNREQHFSEEALIAEYPCFTL